MLKNDISGSTIRTGTIYIGDVGRTEGELEVTGEIEKATALAINNKVSEIGITIADGGIIPLMFFSVKDTGENMHKPDISVVILKNQTSTHAIIQINKSSTDATNITLNILVVKP
tara:strand:+ start:296 stop:640 length:345 start_codon:yes stop_codon:yes gene_type:complete